MPDELRGRRLLVDRPEPARRGGVCRFGEGVEGELSAVSFQPSARMGKAIFTALVSGKTLADCSSKCHRSREVSVRPAVPLSRSDDFPDSEEPLRLST